MIFLAKNRPQPATVKQPVVNPAFQEGALTLYFASFFFFFWKSHVIQKRNAGVVQGSLLKKCLDIMV